MNGHALRELARAIAVVAHDGQSRKGAGEPYFNHVEAVAEACWGWRAKTIAYLHDVVEDAHDPTAMTFALIAFFPEDIILAVRLLSRLPDRTGKKQPYSEFIEVIATSSDPDVRVVKLADVRHNLKDIRDIPGAQKLEARYLRAEARLAFDDPEEDK